MAYILAKTSSNCVRHYFTGELTLQENPLGIIRYVAGTGFLPGDAFPFKSKSEAEYWALILSLRGISEAEWRVIPEFGVSTGDAA